MISMTDPHKALQSLQSVLLRSPESVPMVDCSIHKRFKLHVDCPEGGDRRRFTYINLQGSIVRAIAIMASAGEDDGQHVIAVGYAVAMSCRRQGLAKEILKVAVDEMSEGLRRNKSKSFWLEAMIDARNLASQAVAKAVIGGDPESCVDQISLRESVRYRRYIEMQG